MTFLCFLLRRSSASQRFACCYRFVPRCRGVGDSVFTFLLGGFLGVHYEAPCLDLFAG